MTDIIWVVSSCALIAAVIAFRALFGKKMGAGLRYALWGLVLLRLLIPGTVFSSPVSVESAARQTEVVQNIEAVREVSSIERTDTGSVVGSPIRPQAQLPAQNAVKPDQPAAEPAESAPHANEAVTPAVPEQQLVLSQASQERFERMQKTIAVRDVLSVVWYVGMAAVAAYFLVTNIVFYVKLRKARKLIAADASCRVYSVGGLASSCLFMGSIYVSPEIAEDPEKLRYVLAHECAHRRHGDAVFALLRSAALVVHWYNPLVWAAAFLSRRDSELFADAGALRILGENEYERYGRALIELSTGARVYAPVACTATMMAGSKGELKARIGSIASRKKMGIAVLLAVVVLSLAAAGFAFLGCNETVGPADGGVTPTEAPTSAHTGQPDPTESFDVLTPAVMVDDQLYIFASVPVPDEDREPYDGTVASAVPENEYPTENGTTNFESIVGSPYKLAPEGLYVMYNGGWKLFYPAFDGYVLQEAGALRAFFEEADEQGVKNGEKLFENYDPRDTATWHGSANSAYPSRIVCGSSGAVTELHLFPAGSEPVSLWGTLTLHGFEELREIELGSGASFAVLDVKNCPALEKVTAAEPLVGAAVYSGTLEGGVSLSAQGVTCIIPGETAGTDHTVGVNAYLNGGEGCLRLTAAKGRHALLEIIPGDGYAITGWREGWNREIISRSKVWDLTEDPAFEFSPTASYDEPPLITSLLYQSFPMIPAYPGEAPAASPELARLQPGETLSADIDCDGKADTVLLTVTDTEEGFRSCAVTITLAAHPDSPIKVDPVVERTYDVSLRLLDCDTADNRMELLLMCLNGSDESSFVRCIRVNAQGTGADVFQTPYGSVLTDAAGWEYEDPTGNFDAENGIPLTILTNILDMQLITARLTVTDEGFMLITPFTFGIPYPDPNGRGWRELRRDMEAILLDGSGAEQGSTTLPAGTRMVPHTTDAATWLTFTTEDGRTVRVEIEVASGTVFINGSMQEEYFNVGYAG